MLVERQSLCARRPGTRARRIKRRFARAGAPCAPQARGGEAASLDVVKHLAITCSEWLQLTETANDRRSLKLFNNLHLLSSLRRIYEEGLNDARVSDIKRVAQCQSEWMAFECCSAGRIMAVPIGCNHKLCALCAAHRAERYREKVRALFDRLEKPWFVTLTVPNVRRLTKRTYTLIRQRTRKLLKIYEAWAVGGVYSLETTWNRGTGTWHVHVHLMLDASFAPPVARSEFIRFKRGLEYEWLRLTGGRGWGSADFDYWYRCTHRQQPTEWNRKNRRVIDLRPVRDRAGAAYEVFKYITKVCDFVDDPLAVEEFLRATRGVRMLQTFGSWYGFKFETQSAPSSGLKCTAGCTESHWRLIGRFHSEYVESLPGGKCFALRHGVVRRE